MGALLLSALWLPCGSTDDDPYGQHQPADQYHNYNPHQDPFRGYAHSPPIVKPHSATLLLDFSIVVMMLKGFGNRLGRYNLAAQLA